MKKIFCFDTETTGLDPRIHEIIELTGLMIIDDIIVDSIEIFMRPLIPGNIQEKALDIQGKKLDEIMEYPSPYLGYCKLLNFLKKHVDRFDKNDKLYPMGYNVVFDMTFLRAFFDAREDKYIGSFLSHKMLDPLYYVRYLDYHSMINLESYTLENVAKYFKIPLHAHSSASDCQATFQLWEKINELIFPKITGN